MNKACATCNTPKQKHSVFYGPLRWPVAVSKSNRERYIAVIMENKHSSAWLSTNWPVADTVSHYLIRLAGGCECDHYEYYKYRLCLAREYYNVLLSL